MELTGSCHGVVRELSSVIRSCNGVVWEFPLPLGSVMELTGTCHGVAWELSFAIRSCHGVDLELSGSCPRSLGVVVIELTGSCLCHYEVS